MTQPTFIPSARVAEMLGLGSTATFLAKAAALQEEHYFPPPMPHSARPLLWKTDEVAAWIDRMGRANQPNIDPADIASGRVALFEKARTA